MTAFGFNHLQTAQRGGILRERRADTAAGRSARSSERLDADSSVARHRVLSADQSALRRVRT